MGFDAMSAFDNGANERNMLTELSTVQNMGDLYALKNKYNVTTEQLLDGYPVQDEGGMPESVINMLKQDQRPSGDWPQYNESDPNNARMDEVLSMAELIAINANIPWDGAYDADVFLEIEQNLGQLDDQKIHDILIKNLISPIEWKPLQHDNWNDYYADTMQMGNLPTGMDGRSNPKYKPKEMEEVFDYLSDYETVPDNQYHNVSPMFDSIQKGLGSLTRGQIEQSFQDTGIELMEGIRQLEGVTRPQREQSADWGFDSQPDFDTEQPRTDMENYMALQKLLGNQ